VQYLARRASDVNSGRWTLVNMNYAGSSNLCCD